MSKKRNWGKAIVCLSVLSTIAFTSCIQNKGEAHENGTAKEDPIAAGDEQEEVLEQSLYPAIDSAAFREKNIVLANGDTTGRWPVKGIKIGRASCRERGGQYV